MAQINRQEVTMSRALEQGRRNGKYVFMTIPVSRNRAINGIDELVAVMCEYDDFFKGYEGLADHVEALYGEDMITVAADGVILWEKEA